MCRINQIRHTMGVVTHIDPQIRINYGRALTIIALLLRPELKADTGYAKIRVE